MRWLKEHWFGLLMSIFLLLATVYSALIFASPRYDLQRRGFIPCTERLAKAAANCDNSGLVCIMEAIWENSRCDFGVISAGVKNWLGGKQKYPWSNYLFEPELLSDRRGNNDPELNEFYQQNPDLRGEMAKLKELNEEQDKDEYPQK